MSLPGLARASAMSSVTEFAVTVGFATSSNGTLDNRLIGAKDSTERLATAQAVVFLQPATLEKIQRGKITKGDVLAVAQVAGIMGAKRTPDLIPMCHPILLTGVDISFQEVSQPDHRGRCSITITASAKTTGPTGVEMEAMTAASVAALTIYDMCKAVDNQMAITGVQLLEKTKQPVRGARIQ